MINKIGLPTSESRKVMKQGQVHVDRVKKSLEGVMFKTRPQKQSVFECLKHCSLTSSLHLGLFVLLQISFNKNNDAETAEISLIM